MKDRAGLLLAIATVLIANAAALAHVWSNRASSEPEVTLTERELPKRYQPQDNSGTSFDLLRTQGPGVATDAWFDRSKLQELGFDCTVAPDSEAGRRHYRRMLPRAAFVALEFDGPAWQRYLAEVASRGRLGAGPAEVRLEQALRNTSRLVAIDAASDAGVLRRRYPDAAKVLVVAAKVRVNAYAYYSREEPSPGVSGIIETLDNEINVPLALSTQISDLGGRAPEAEPRYRVRLRFGSRREPWVTGITRLR